MTITMLTEAFVKALELSGITSKLIATGGTVVVDDASIHAFEANEFIALSDAVFAVCNGENIMGDAVNFMAPPYNWITIPAGVPIIAPTGYKITSVQLTSGSVAFYR